MILIKGNNLNIKQIKHEEKGRLNGYENNHFDYNSRRYGNPAMKYYAVLRENKIHQIINKYFPSKNNLTIIDIGCGTGVVIDHLLSLDNRYNIFGLDFSKEMLKKTVIQKQYIDSRVSLCKASAFDVPFKDEIYDVVICTRFIHQYSDNLKIKLLNEMKRIVKKDGIVIVEFYSFITWFIRFIFKLKNKKSIDYFKHCTVKSKISNLIGSPTFIIQPIMLPFGTKISKFTNLNLFKVLNQFATKLNFNFLFDQYFVIFKK